MYRRKLDGIQSWTGAVQSPRGKLSVSTRIDGSILTSDSEPDKYWMLIHALNHGHVLMVMAMVGAAVSLVSREPLWSPVVPSYYGLKEHNWQLLWPDFYLFEVSEVIELRIHQEALQKQKHVREG